MSGCSNHIKLINIRNHASNIQPLRLNIYMKQRIAHISLLVKDYDEAIRFYTEKLDFVLLEDTVLDDSKRWVRIAAADPNSCALLLAKAIGELQESRVGDQTGGRVFLFLYTDDFDNDYKKYVERGVQFVRQPVKETWGTVAVFKDLYGNLWDMISE